MRHRVGRRWLKPLALLSLLLASATTGVSAQTLKAIKDRGHLVCGVSQGLSLIHI